MPEPETPENIWRSQTEEKQPKVQTALTPGELCAMAQSREKLNLRVSRAILAVTIAFAGAFLYNIYRIDQPWIRFGQAWTLAVIVYLFTPALNGGRRTGLSDSCANFLEREHEQRRNGYLRLRRRLFLLIPGILACWWGKPQLVPVSPWLFAVTGAALVLVWIAFGKAAEKAARDRDEILRNIEEPPALD